MKSLNVIENCDGCGACCTGQGALPIHLVGDNFKLDGCKKLTPELEEELMTAAIKFMANGFPPDGSPCIWYDPDTRRCKHYEYRPTLCRDEMEVGSDGCRRWRKLVGIDKSTTYRVKGGKLVLASR